jgi:hypothetical protein
MTVRAEDQMVGANFLSALEDGRCRLSIDEVRLAFKPFCDARFAPRLELGFDLGAIVHHHGNDRDGIRSCRQRYVRNDNMHDVQFRSGLER